MTSLTLSGIRLAGQPGAPLLILGPSLGTSVTTLWSAVAAHLGDRFCVVGWDLPGHGTNPGGHSDFEIADLAKAVLALADEMGSPADSFAYAGDSVGGAVGLQLALDAGERLTHLVAVCTGAAIGTPDAWAERAATVRRHGTESLLADAPGRWFTPGFIERHPELTARFVDGLSTVDDASYAQVCEALSRFDLRNELAAITVPVLAIAGAHDAATPPENLELIADSVQRGQLHVIEDAAHLTPVERPEVVAALMRRHLGADRYNAGMAVRRAVLGDAYVDAATANATDLTREFQRYITEYAWGGIWTRPGLDRRSRSMITLTALIARGHHEELAMHLRAARTIGLTDDEIKEVIMQSAIYCGVPDANTAFRIAQRVLGDSEGPA